MKPSRVATELRIIANRIDCRVASSHSPFAKTTADSIKGVLRHLSGTIWDQVLTDPLDAQDAKTSQLLWYAMKELGMEDWKPDTDIDDVTEKMKELASSVGATEGDIQRAMDYALKNFDDYHEHYNPEKPPEGLPLDR